jgi:hypothetical protein
MLYSLYYCTAPRVDDFRRDLNTQIVLKLYKTIFFWSLVMTKRGDPVSYHACFKQKNKKSDEGPTALQ